MRKELENEIIRLAKEDALNGLGCEIKYELNDVLADCGYTVEDLDEAYNLYFRTYCEYKTMKEDVYGGDRIDVFSL